MVNYEIAFKKPFLDIKKLLIGLLLSVASSVIVYAGQFGGPSLVSLGTLVGLLIGLFLSGYYVRIALLTFKKKNILPEWKDWKDLFVKGLLVTVLGLIYSIPIIIIAVVFGGMALISVMSQGEAISAANLSGGIAVVVVVSLSIAYILPVAILSFIKQNKFGAAFAFREIFKKAFSKPYVLAWLLSFAYFLLLGIVLSWIPVVGTSISGFITGITGMTLLAEAFISA